MKWCFLWCRVVLFLCCCFFLCVLPVRADQKIRAGIRNDRGDVSFDEQARLVALSMELLQEIAAAEDWEVEFVSINWKDYRALLDAGEIDLFLGLGYSDERAQEVDFNHESIITLWPQVCFQKGRAIDSFSDLEGLKVGVGAHRTSSAKFIEVLDKNGVSCEVVPFEMFEDLLAAVRGGDVDAGVIPYQIKSQFDDGSNVEFGSLRFAPIDLHFVSKKGSRDQLLSRIDLYLADWKKEPDSVYYQLLGLWNGVEPVTRMPLWVMVVVGGIILMISLLCLALGKRVRHAVRALAVSQGRSRKLLQLTSVPMGVINADGCVEYLNDSFVRVTGYKKEDIPTIEDWYRLAYPNESYRAEAMEQWDRAAEKAEQSDGKIGPLEFDITIKDGRVREMEVSAVVADGSLLASFFDTTDRNQTLAEVTMATERLQMATEAANVGVWDLDLLKNRLVWDDMMYAIYGLAPETFQPTVEDWTRRLHSDDQDVAVAAFQRALDCGEKFDTEFRILHLDGSTHYIRALAEVHVDETGKAVRVIGTNWDVTASREMMEALRVSDQRYRQLFENMTVGFALHEMIFDEAGNPSDYRYLEINPAFTEMTGLGQDAIGKTVKELLPETEPEWIDLFGFVVQTGEPTAYQSYAKALGKYFDVWAFRPQLMQFAVIVNDISERMQLEKEIAQLARFPEENPNPVLRVSEDYDVQYANGEGRRLLSGTAPEEGRFPLAWRFLVDAALDSGEVQKGEIQCGEEAYLLSFSPVQESRFVNLYGMNITREKRIEEQYRQTQKMEAVGQLAGGVAHDFNNILQTILGFSEMMLMKLERDSTLHEDVLEIQRAARRAADLTRQLLAFSRKQDVEFKMVQLNDVIMDHARMLQRIIGEDVRLDLDLQADLDLIRADVGQLQQVTMNLCLNARDAMCGSGVIELKTEQVVLDETAARTMPQSLPGDYICLSVKDTGMGMSDDVLERAFEPFFTTKEVGAGSGLGLVVVYGIVKQHHGWVFVETVEGEGSVFKVYLPILREEEDELAASDPAEIPVGPEGQGEQILVVEDDSILRDLAMRVLLDAGYQAVAAESAQQAIDLFKSAGKKFDMVFSDVVLPDQNGLALAATLRELCPELPVLLCSGHAEHRIQMDQIREKGYFFLKKPFSVMLLLRTIREVLVSAQFGGAKN